MGCLPFFVLNKTQNEKEDEKMILEKLGIYGWKEQDENLVMASLLTGDPLLLIGNHGCAKTHIAGKIAQALSKRFLAYDASKAMFEDVLGYPNLQKLNQGVVEYVPSKVTIWDKEFVLIDELNRALPELQSKWLEVIRSRRIMGFETQVKWVWSAMNPLSYSATQALDEALIGRFAIFLYPPDVLQMNEEDRIRVTTLINGDDAPGLGEWISGGNGKTMAKDAVEATGEKTHEMISKAAAYFIQLRDELNTLSEFLAKFADLLMRETDGEIALDGRRLGFIYRNILANRAVEIAKDDIFGAEAGSFADSARYVVQSSIPIGLNDESLKREEAVHKMEVCFDLLSSFFEKGSEMDTVNRIYELFTTDDLMRKAEILLTENLGEFVASKAWNDMINSDKDITLLAYTALQIEARRPGTVPKELLESLSSKVSPKKLCSDCLPKLRGEAIEYIEEVEALLDQDSDLAQLVAYNRVSKLASKDVIKPKDIEETGNLIRQDLSTFGNLIENGQRAVVKGGEM